MNSVMARKVITSARGHLGEGKMESSARSCLADAVSLYDAGEYQYAAVRALHSLDFSLGILHPEYRKYASILRADNETSAMAIPI